MKKRLFTLFLAIVLSLSTATVCVSAAASPFTDVKESSYYYDAVMWAYENDVTKGVTATTFSPGSTCTRGQVVTFLWRAKGQPEPETKVNPFKDVSESAYYYKAVLWAVEKGITNGTTETSFSPDSTCSNGHVLTFLWRALGQPAANGSSAAAASYADSAYYKQAVAWADTAGMLADAASGFKPEGNCPRSDIVCHLYSALTENTVPVPNAAETPVKEQEAPPPVATNPADAAIAKSLQGMWLETTNASGADNRYNFCILSGNTYCQEQVFGASSRQVVIYRGTFSIENRALCITINSTESYQENGFKNAEPSGYSWNPRALGEVEKTRFTTAAGLSYTKISERPESPLASWGLTPYTEAELDDIINNVVYDEYSTYADYDIPDFGSVNRIKESSQEIIVRPYYAKIGTCYSTEYTYEVASSSTREAQCKKYYRELEKQGFTLAYTSETKYSLKINGKSQRITTYAYRKEWKNGHFVEAYILPHDFDNKHLSITISVPI